jgi:hypothetical protein
MYQLKPVGEADMAKQIPVQKYSIRNFETVCKLPPSTHKFFSPLPLKGKGFLTDFISGYMLTQSEFVFICIT